ncbi:MAG: DNA polymerase I [Clostridiaceae bacterium]|nr:DNA polymerase I [Clostridiaceae bacterium]
MAENELLLLVDTNSLLNRAYYALAGRSNMKAPDGTPTGALYPFFNMIFQYLDMYNPKYMAAAFDLPGDTFRHREYKDYKAGRRAMPDDLALQFPIARELLNALGFVTVAVEEFEADDIIGTLAREGEEANLDVVILSGDRDLFQLLGPRTKVQFLSSSRSGPQSQQVTAENLYEKYGVTAEQWVDVKALMGDPSDNIPGVKGVGEKTALNLIREFGSKAEVFKHVDKQKGALKANLEAGEAAADLSYKLAYIERDIDIPEEMNPLSRSGEDFQNGAALANLFAQLGFRSYFERFPELQKYLGDELKAGHRLLDQAENLQEFTSARDLLASAAANEPIAFFLPTDSLNGIFLTANGFYTVTDIKQAAQLLSEEVSFVTWDIKQQLREQKYLAQNRNIFDSMVAAYLLQEDGRSSDFDYSMQAILGDDFMPAVSHEEQLPLLADRDALRKKQLYQILKAYPIQKQDIVDHGLEYLAEIEMQLAVILAAMEVRGIKLDKERLESNSDDMQEELDTLERSIYDLAGHEFNINSPQQLSKLLFDERHLPPGKKTASGYSTAADELQRLYHLDPMIPLILEYRELSKLRGTFVEGLLKEIGEDGRVHTNFNQTVTSTGRLSSSNPNLQNIPIRTERGREIRKVFVAPSGRLLVAADYSQIELRLLAHLSKDEALLQAFRDGEDIHSITAATLFHKNTADVTSDERSVAKTVNFSITYGISEFGLARDLGISRQEAGSYIKRYHEQYPKVISWLDKQAEIGKEQGYVQTLFHRRRYLPELASQNYNVYQFGVRAAMNAPVQGTAADLIKIAMVKAVDAIAYAKLDANILLQVHDELILEVDAGDAETAALVLKRVMEEAMNLDVPLLADTKIGPNWGEME